jgi:PHD/YefM family antitoxin component YafN of YafNO toxin-antitoxin module
MVDKGFLGFSREEQVMEIHKKIVLDENQKPIAVQIPIEEFERMEEVIENYGLARLIDEASDDERLSVQEAKPLSVAERACGKLNTGNVF